MAKTKRTTEWTKTQLDAITTEDKTLLVSAAAGSGKTSTLIERIVRSVFREENPLKIEDMLIVTFTHTAAEDLRAKLKKRFIEIIDSRPADPYDERKLVMLAAAKICTIDSFCTDFLRSHCDKLNLTPAFRVPDKAEIAVLAENVLDGIFNRIYDGDLPEVCSAEELFELCDCLTDTGRQDDLRAILFKIHHDTTTLEEGVGAIRTLVEEYNPEGFTSVEKTALGAYCMERAREVVAHHISVFRKMSDELVARGNPSLDGLLGQVNGALNLLTSIDAETAYDGLREALLRADLSEGAIKNSDKTLPPTTMARTNLKSDLADLKDGFFIYSTKDWQVAYEGLYRILDVLCRVVEHYDRVLREEKTKRGICEFSDIERYVFECLWQGGEITDTARLERAKYSAVYIDEYQDVNDLQNKIFEAIATDTNRFMVGDIKQSIYRFRSANPDIFANMKRSYPPLENAKNSTRAAIFMSENFRCDRGIIDFVNSVFDKMFHCMRKTIGYTPKDALVFAKVKEGDPEPPNLKPVVCLIDSSSAVTACNKAGVPKVDKLLAPEVVAQKIREILDEEEEKLRIIQSKKAERLAQGLCEDEELAAEEKAIIRPSDIAILMRSVKKKGGLYKDALQRRSIPCEITVPESFFSTSEIQLAMCLLNAVDNPRKDTYLAGLMLSPLYSFTADELTRIAAAEGDSLWSKLRAYTDVNPEFDKGRAFIDTLGRYRMLAEGMPTDKLIMRLYHETGLLTLSARLGLKDKLIQLYDYARGFEGTSFKGLYNFIHYLNSITERSHSLDDRKALRSESAVNIMTVHGSKGLEFKVVFYVELNTPFGGGGGGAAPRFEYGEGFGFGMALRTPSGLALVNNPTREIIKNHRRRKDMEEEARVLYVGLTRAEQRLYLVSAAGKKLDTFEKEVNFQREYFSTHTAYSFKNALSMVLCTAGCNTVSPDEFLKSVPELLKNPAGEAGNIAENEDGEDVSANKNAEKTDTSSHVSADELKKRLDFEYPDSLYTTLPEKLSVSVLHPGVVDGTLSGETGADALRRDRARLKLPTLGIRPKFTYEGKPSPAERGTATHLFMQFARPEEILAHGVDTEISRLLDLGFISERDKDALRREELEMFARSELIQDIVKAKRVYRELRFNVKLPAELFVSEENREKYSAVTVLVQGVIDCLIENADGTHRLIDYKTDRISKEAKDDPSLAEEQLREAHREQLEYYALAVEKMFSRRPTSCEIYSLALGKCIKI